MLLRYTIRLIRRRRRQIGMHSMRYAVIVTWHSPRLPSAGVHAGLTTDDSRYFNPFIWAGRTLAARSHPLTSVYLLLGRQRLLCFSSVYTWRCDIAHSFHARCIKWKRSRTSAAAVDRCMHLLSYVCHVHEGDLSTFVAHRGFISGASRYVSIVIFGMLMRHRC